MLVALQRLDLLADLARLLVAVPHAAQRDALAFLQFCPQRLAQPPLVVGDQVRGGGEDVRRRAVVALQPDDGGAGEILLEAQDVADLRAAPAVDRLVVVADAADVLRALRQQPQPQVLRHVGVLVLVDQDVAEAAVILLQHVGMLLPQGDADASPGRRNRPRSPRRAAPGTACRSRPPCRWRTRRHRRLAPCRASSARSFQRWMMPESTRAGHFLSSMPSACSSCLISRVWSSVSRMVKLLFSPTSSAWRRSTRTPTEWKVPSHMPSAAPPISLRDAVEHLARRLVGEGDGQDLRRPGAAGDQLMGDAGGQHARLAGAGAGQHQQRAALVDDRQALLRVQPLEIGAGARRRARRARSGGRARDRR